jgi:predicted HTH domain antitoxin
MTELTVTLPSEIKADDAKLLLMIKLYEVGKLSLGQAAKYSGYSKATFMELLGKHDVPVFDAPPEEVEAEFNQ